MQIEKKKKNRAYVKDEEKKRNNKGKQKKICVGSRAGCEITKDEDI